MKNMLPEIPDTESEMDLVQSTTSLIFRPVMSLFRVIMGTRLNSYSFTSSITNLVRGRKRKFCDTSSLDEMEKIIDIAMHTPKRKKLGGTVQYIYQALFVEGRDSDVTVIALDEEYKLHKVYLSQSPYFASMFGGNWKETGETQIHINVVDPLITKEALRIVFSALYNDEVRLEPVSVVSVLATATMLQLDGLIDRCGEVMIETINPFTALNYYEAACQYGDLKLKASCVQWFLVNLMFNYVHNLSELALIPIALMEHLVSDNALCVMKTEIALYVLLTQWMYLHNRINNEEINMRDISNFYSSRPAHKPYLLTSEGSAYMKVFRALRLQHLISHNVDVELLIKDNIIPKTWLDRVILQSWKVTLRINQNEEKGPATCTDEQFLKTALRCGRTISTEEKHMWRWSGFNYGLDLIMIVDDNSLTVKRNHKSEFERLLSLQNVRHIIIAVTIYSLNDQKQIAYMQTSGIKRLSLNKNEEVILLTFNSEVTFPLIISANILYTSPFEEVKSEVKSTIQSI